MKAVSLLIVGSFLLGNVEGQSFKLKKDDVKFIGYNVISSMIIGGLGSGVHHKHNETFIHAALNGVWKGSISGVTQSISKLSIRDNDYLITSRLIHSISQSMMCNAYNNKPLISNYYLTLYCFNFHTDFRKVDVKIDPLTIVSVTYLTFSKGYSFDIKQTLYSGSIVYISSHKPIIQGITIGQSVGNTISAFKNSDPFFQPLAYSDANFKSNLRHEEIHTLQYDEFDVFTPKFHDKIFKYVNVNINFLTTYSINSLVNGYKGNYFEKEANNYSK